MKKNYFKNEDKKENDDKRETFFIYSSLFQNILDKKFSEIPKTIKINCLEENYEEFYYIHMVKSQNFLLNFIKFLQKRYQKISKKYLIFYKNLINLIQLMKMF
jgi:hypothetical protein